MLNRHRLSVLKGGAATLCMLSLTACSWSSPTPPAPVASEQLAQPRGTVLSTDWVRDISSSTLAKAAEDELVATKLGAPSCDAKIYNVRYVTIGVHGEPADATTAVIVPDGCDGPYPMMALTLGTRTMDNAPFAELVRRPFGAGYGYVMVVSDYLGLGGSSYPFHPYLHADSEASAVIDAMRAARTVAQMQKLPLADEIVMFGASQGGHSALATLRAIEQDYADEFTLSAVMASAGPYDMTNTFMKGWDGMTSAGFNPLAAELFSYTTISYQRVYENIYTLPSEVFQPPYDGMVEQYFPGELNLFVMAEKGLFPKGPALTTLRQPSYVEAVANNPEHPFRQALAANDLLDWTPKAPVLLCGSSGDTIVDFNNTRTAYAAFAERGAKQVTMLDTADEVPEGLDGLQHHIIGGGRLCTYTALTQLFEPIRAALRSAP